GSYNDHAVCCPGTVNSCRRSIFQDLNRFDIVNIKIPVGASGHSINNIQGIIALEISQPAYLNFRFGAGSSRRVNFYPGYEPLNSPAKICGVYIFYLRWTYRRYSTGYVFSLLLAISYNNQLLSLQSLRMQGDINIGSFINRLI